MTEVVNSKVKKTHENSFNGQNVSFDETSRVRKHLYNKNKRFLHFILSQEKKKVDSMIVKSVLPSNVLNKRYDTTKSRDFDDLELFEPINMHEYLNLHPCTYFGFTEAMKFVVKMLDIDFDWKKSDMMDEWYELRIKDHKMNDAVIDLPYKTFRINSLVGYFEIVKSQYRQLKLDGASINEEKENKYYCTNRVKKPGLDCFMSLGKNRLKNSAIKFDSLHKCNEIFMKLLNESLATLHKESRDNVRIVVELLGYLFDFNQALTSSKLVNVFTNVQNEISSMQAKMDSQSAKIKDLKGELNLLKVDNIKLTAQNNIYQKNQTRYKTILNDFNLFYIVNRLKDSRMESVRAYFKDMNIVINEINKLQTDSKDSLTPESLNIINKASQGIQNHLDNMVTMKTNFDDGDREIIDYSMVPSRIDYKPPISAATQTGDSYSERGMQTEARVNDGFTQTERTNKDKKIQAMPNTDTVGVQFDGLKSMKSVRQSNSKQKSDFYESIVMDDHLTPIKRFQKSSFNIKFMKSFASKISFMSEAQKSANNISMYNEKIKNSSFNMEAYLHRNERFKETFRGFKRKTNRDKIILHLYNVLKIFNEHVNFARVSLNRLVDVSTSILKSILLSKSVQDPLIVIFRYFYDKSRNVNFIKKSFASFINSLKSREGDSCANVQMLYHMIRTDKYNMVPYNIQMLRIIYETLLPL